MQNIVQPNDSFAIMQWMIFAAGVICAVGAVLLASAGAKEN